MVGWAISVCYSVIICLTVFLVLPEGRIAVFCKPLIALSVIVAILAPIRNGNNENAFLSEVGAISDISADENFLTAINQMKIAEFRQKCINIAENYGCICEEVSIRYNVTTEKTVSVTGAEIILKNPVITSDEEHIDILRRLKDAISAYLKVSVSGVVIVEK